MLNLVQKRRFVCTLMAVLLLSIATASVANARDVDVTSPSTPVEAGQVIADTPNLIMTLEGNVTAPESQSDQPNLYQAQDSPPAVDDNSTLVIAPHNEGGDAEHNNLIATQTTPDVSVLVAGCVSLLVAAAAVGVLLFSRRRKTD